MKHLFKYLSGLALAAFLLSSCEQITGGGALEHNTDIKLVGNWIVIKYEAYDTRDSLIKTLTDMDSIYRSFYRFDFDVNPASATGLIVWVDGKMFTSMDYSYDNSWLRFGDLEHAPADLSETSLIFKTGIFAPIYWKTETGRLIDPIDKVKVYCTKSVTQEQ